MPGSGQSGKAGWPQDVNGAGRTVPESFYSPRRKNGMTLLEVLVSVVILGVALVAVYQPLLFSLNALNFVGSRLEASHLMSGMIWEFREKARASGKIPKSKGAETLMGNQKTYEFRIVTHGSTENDPVDVNALIEWDAGRQKKSIRRAFYVMTRK